MKSVFNFAEFSEIVAIIFSPCKEPKLVPVKNIAAGYALESAHDDQKVEVLFEHEGDAERIVLKYSRWVDGLGWCCQKTIRLEADQLDDLHRALTVARHRVRRKRAGAGEVVSTAQVIQLPTVA